MAYHLIRLKLKLLRNSMNGARAGTMVMGGLGGLILAIGTVALAVLTLGHAKASTDLLALAFLFWTLGWALGPALLGTGDTTLRPSYFALLPIRGLALARGMLAAAFVGIGAPVTLVAFSALVIHGAGLGAVPRLLSVPAALLQLVLAVLLARLVISAADVVLRTRAAVGLAGLVWASVLAMGPQGWWFLIPAIRGKS